MGRLSSKLLQEPIQSISQTLHGLLADSTNASLKQRGSSNDLTNRGRNTGGRLSIVFATILTVTASLFSPSLSAMAADQAQDSEDLETGPAPAAVLTMPTQTEGVAKPSSRIIEGHINYLVPKGTPFKLKLAQVPTNGMKLLDRDMDGKLYPAKEGQEISAKTSEDFYVDDNKVIPEGTVFHGKVSKIVPPRHAGRPGWLEISFDKLTTPDGRVFKFAAQADNFKPSTVKSKAKGVGRVTAYAGGGAIVGAMVAYEIFGLHTTLAMHGWNIVGGAGGGALLATCYALWKRGSPATLEPGDDLNMNIDSDLLMPAAVEASSKRRFVNRPGINVNITSAKVIKDGLEGNMLRVKAVVDNDTDEPLRSIDVYALDSTGNKLPLIAGPDDSSQFIFEVGPHSRSLLTMHFLMEHPKVKCELIWLDHGNRQICYRAPLLVAKKQ